MRTPRALLAAAAVLLALTACGGGNDTTTPEPEATSTQATSEAPPASPSAGGSSAPSQQQIPGTKDASGTVTIGGTETDLGELQCVEAPTVGTAITSISATSETAFALQIDPDGVVKSFSVSVNGKPYVYAEGAGVDADRTSSKSGSTDTITGTIPDLAAGGQQVEVSAEITCG